MEGKFNRKWKTNGSLLKHLQRREISSAVNRLLKQRFQFTDSLVGRLGLDVELKGHQGCVNCLEWAPNGQHLASGSDDTNIILWDPFRHKQLETIPTPHKGNIFSVKFLADENLIATGAGDYRVVVQSVENALTKGTTPLLECMCHLGRVKRLATCPDQPSVFWSGGEDGLIIQYDMREPHKCFGTNKVLVNLQGVSEIKCIAVNPTRPEFIAAGVNDCFVRLYDRRMIKLTTGTFNSTFPLSNGPNDPGSVQYYAPGHLAKEYANVRDCKLAVTYIAFNSAGTEMLANIGGEQIYLFDVNGARHINELLDVAQYVDRQRNRKMYTSSCSNCGGDELTKISSNTIDRCACFYMRRASKGYNRQWVSDLYCAVRDYLHVINYWPDHKQAYIELIKCMIALKWPEEANQWLNYFRKIYPDFNETVSAQIKSLVKDLEKLKLTRKLIAKKNQTDDNADDDDDLVATDDNDDTDEYGNNNKVTDADELQLRLDSMDFELRYLGHCNTTTDIKEVNFLGDNDDYICAGSDEGIIFIWDKKTTDVVRALFGDISIVNCVQPHPSACAIASSGIDPAVKIWTPMPEDGVLNIQAVNDIDTIIKANQERMCMDPFESMLANYGHRLFGNMDGSSFPGVPTYVRH